MRFLFTGSKLIRKSSAGKRVSRFLESKWLYDLRLADSVAGSGELADEAFYF